MLYPNVEELRQNYLNVMAEPEFQKEFNKSPRLKNKFGWVNQTDYMETCHE